MPGRPFTLIGIPSLDLGPRWAERNDAPSLEERWLFLLFALRDPLARVAVVTSDRVSPDTVEYLLALAGVKPSDRLGLFALDDSSRRPLAQKLLARPDVLDEVRRFTAGGDAWILPFDATAQADQDVGRALGVPVFGFGPRFAALGTKSGGRRLLRAAGLPVPAGEEDVHGVEEVRAAIRRLHASDPALREVVVKLDRGVTGDGNAVVPVADADGALAALPDEYRDLLADGCVVEELVRGDATASPSVQVRVEAAGVVDVVATHDQLLGGPLGQAYAGCQFPADAAYAEELAAHGYRLGEHLRDLGAAGRFAVDFVAARYGGVGWLLRAVEVNLREGATTHPHGALALLTGGRYDPASGRFVTAAGAERRLRATDSLRAARPVAWPLVRHELRRRGLEWDRARERGVICLMQRAVEREGRLSAIAIAESREACDELMEQTAIALAAASSDVAVAV
jgi:hypothetical protein